MLYIAGLLDAHVSSPQGFAKGPSIPTVGSVQVSWFTGQPAAASLSKSVPSTDFGNDDVAMKEDEPERAPSPHDDLTQEDMAVVGWGGGDGEDEFGMM